MGKNYFEEQDKELIKVDDECTSENDHQGKHQGRGGFQAYSIREDPFFPEKLHRTTNMKLEVR